MDGTLSHRVAASGVSLRHAMNYRAPSQSCSQIPSQQLFIGRSRKLWYRVLGCDLQHC